MKRILFVDDEPKVLEGLENLLFPFMDDWDMAFAESGDKALLLLEEERFDVIVTDMRMPKMDGATLLHRVKDRYPDVVRIVLSGHSELEAALRVMPIAHQFLSKPCGAETLVRVLRRACDLQALINDEVVRGLIGNLGELPARPKIYSELTMLLADEKASLGDVGDIIEQDIGISTKILHIVNTAFFARGNVVTSVKQAVPRLGAAFVKDLVLAVEVFRDFRCGNMAYFSIDALHDHSFLTASIAKSLLDERRESEHAFLAGTLHDVGKLILAAALPEHLSASLAQASRTGDPLYVVEEDLAGVTHAEIGAYLLGLWGLPYTVMEAVANHHRPQRTNPDSFDVTTAVYVANILAHEVKNGAEDAALDLDFLERLGVADRLRGWREVATNLSEGAK